MLLPPLVCNVYIAFKSKGCQSAFLRIGNTFAPPAETDIDCDAPIIFIKKGKSTLQATRLMLTTQLYTRIPPIYEKLSDQFVYWANPR